MNLKSKTMVMGLGNCGCKIAKLFADNGYTAMFANGSEQDLKVLGNIKGIYKLNGFDGFGGHRERAMDCLVANSDFTEALEAIQQKIVVLVYAAGGSTGSGLSTIVAQYIADVFEGEKIIVTVPVLPSTSESINKHKNAYQAIEELTQIDGLGASFFISNDNQEDLRYVNKVFYNLLNAFLTDDSWGEANNFDESERIEMLSEAGAMIVCLQKFGEGLEKLLTDNIFAPLQNDKVVGNIGVIHSSRSVNLDTLVAELGKPLNIYEGFGGKGTLLAASGLSFPLDHITNLGKLAIEGQAERQRNMESAKASLLPSLNFGEVKKPMKTLEKPTAKKQSSREALLALRAKRN